MSYIAHIFQTHHSAAEYLHFTRIHAHVNMYRNNRVCKQSTATEGCHLFFNINQTGGQGSVENVESKYYMIATKKKKKHTHMHTHTQQQHVPEPPAIRSDEWCTDPIRQIHTSRCSEIFPTKGVQIKKCPPGNDQMFHQKGTETSPIQQVPCLSGICLFPV